MPDVKPEYQVPNIVIYYRTETRRFRSKQVTRKQLVPTMMKLLRRRLECSARLDGELVGQIGYRQCPRIRKFWWWVHPEIDKGKVG